MRSAKLTAPSKDKQPDEYVYGLKQSNHYNGSVQQIAISCRQINPNKR